MLLTTTIPGLDLLPGSRSFPGRGRAREGRRDAGGPAAAALTGELAGYDFVLIDCPPSLGTLTQTALSASTEVLMPIQCEYFAMEGLTQMIEVITE